MHVNSFLQSAPVLLAAAVGSLLLAVASLFLRSSRDRARRLVRQRAEAGAPAAHGVGLIVLSPVATLGLAAVAAFFVVQLVHGQTDGLGRPVVLHLELLGAGVVLLVVWWWSAYLRRVPEWVLPSWVQGRERDLSVVARRLMGG